MATASREKVLQNLEIFYYYGNKSKKQFWFTQNSFTFFTTNQIFSHNGQ